MNSIIPGNWGKAKENDGESFSLGGAGERLREQNVATIAVNKRGGP
ncbi:hypothetical protein L8C07_09770 [Paenibacillus sp. CMAA1739]|nr:hypothetical protein [Paenibacillus sp. CMAA1739]MEC4566231.1 hypothetical protein [Paenibacillus sp. CMAA1739]